MNIPLYNTLYENEAALVKGCKEGNAHAQKTLYNRYAEQLMMICLRYIGNKEDAQDVLMQSLVECFKNIHGFEHRGEGALKAWLKKVTVNHCLMQLRKQRNIFRELDDALAEQLPETQSENPLAQLSAKEIMQWIQELPPGYRTIFNLYVFEDMGHKEIAAALNISESTSKSQLHKARTLLQTKITKSQSKAL